MIKAKRNIGIEILNGLREINRGQHGRVTTDLAAFDSRKRERSQTFDAFVRRMKRRGLI